MSVDNGCQSSDGNGISERIRSDVIHRLGLTTHNIEQTFESVVELLKLATDMPVCLFSIVEGDRQFFKAKRGLEVDGTPRDMAICAYAISQRDTSQIFVIENAEEDGRVRFNPLVTGPMHLRFYAGIPIHALGNIAVGTICVIDEQPRAMTEKIATALQNARELVEAVLAARSEAIRDHLTGLFNRKFFDECFQREWRRAYRESIPVTVMLADIDDFKAYNDHYGHQAGDDCLVQVADILKQCVHRSGDMVARYGGEEFVFVLPSTDTAGAAKLSQRIVQAIYEANIPHEASASTRVTISIGYSVAMQSSDLNKDGTDIISAADKALYSAKDKGRNQAQYAPLITTN